MLELKLYPERSFASNYIKKIFDNNFGKSLNVYFYRRIAIIVIENMQREMIGNSNKKIIKHECNFFSL